MKTAEEYLTKETDFYLNWELPERNKMIALLKGYANQKLDEASELAKVMHVEQDGDPIDTTDMFCVKEIKDNMGKPTYIIADKQSILSLKDKV